MSTDAIFAVTRFGLAFERSRMEAASRSIAAADVPLTQRSNSAIAANGFTQALEGGANANASPASDVGHQVLDPANPLAGPDGMSQLTT